MKKHLQKIHFLSDPVELIERDEEGQNHPSISRVIGKINKILFKPFSVDDLVLYCGKVFKIEYVSPSVLLNVCRDGYEVIGKVEICDINMKRTLLFDEETPCGYNNYVESSKYFEAKRLKKEKDEARKAEKVKMEQEILNRKIKEDEDERFESPIGSLEV